MSGKTITIRDAQIVNGLQSSVKIYEYFQQTPKSDEKRNVLVRLIKPTSEASRDRIIKATNSQTPIPPAHLRATDKVQRDIEDFFQGVGFYYERRKNQYKNLGRRKDEIVSITFLAQAVMAMVLGQPNTSRGRPSTLLKDDDDYGRVFSSAYPVQAYLVCAKSMRRVEAFLRTEPAGYAAQERLNIKFHLARFAVSMLLDTTSVSAQSVATLDDRELTCELLGHCLRHVWQVFESTKQKTSFPSDRIGKGKEFVTALESRMLDIINGALALEQADEADATSTSRRPQSIGRVSG